MKDYPFFKLYIAHFQRDIIGKSFEQIGEYIVSSVSAWMDGDIESMPLWMSDEYAKLAEKSQKLAENGRKGGQAKAKQILANASNCLAIGKQRREEKSRVDKNRVEEIRKEKKEEVIFPNSLDNETFKASWNSWVVYRKEIKKKLTPSMIASQLKKMSTMGQSKAISMIEHTIAMGWTGLREEEEKKGLKQASQGPVFHEVGRWPTEREIRSYGASDGWETAKVDKLIDLSKTKPWNSDLWATKLHMYNAFSRSYKGTK